MRTLIYSSTIAVLTTVSSTVSFGANLSPRLASGEVQIQRVCVMPLEVSMQKSGMKGGEGMSKESEAWSATLGEVVTAQLIAAKAEVVWGPADAERAPESEKQTVAEAQRKYDTVATQLHKKSRDLKKSRYSLGDEVALLPCAAKSDAILFVHADAKVLTGGKKAFGTLVAGPSRSTAVVRTSFVDAKSGEVLAYAQLFAVGDKFKNNPEGAYGKPLSKEFQKMYVGAGRSKRKK